MRARSLRALGTIAGTELRRFLRDRSNIFFVFIFPLLLVLLVGSQFGGGGSQGEVGVAGDRDSELSRALVGELDDTDVAVDHDDADALREQVARGRMDVAVLLDEGAESAFGSGEAVELSVIVGNRPSSPAVLERVRTAANAVALRQGQVDALVATGADEARARSALDAAAQRTEPPRLQVTDVDEVAQELGGLGQFDLGAASQTLLFVFLISLAGSTTLIQARRLGVVGRTLAAPVSALQVLLGQALGRWTIAMFQGLYIMLATALLFSVDWGSLWLSVLLVAVFALVAAGAAMLLGSLIDNEGAAVGVGVGLGLVLAAMGGAMAPLEVFPDTLQTVAHVTPHAWAYDAFAEIQRHEGTLVDVLDELGVLAAMAVVLLAAGAWALRRSTSRGL